MPDPITLLEKSCGHYGYVRSHYPQDTIPCSQCSISMVDIDKILVPITRKIHTEGQIPDLSNGEMAGWIKKQLEAAYEKRR